VSDDEIYGYQHRLELVLMGPHGIRDSKDILEANKKVLLDYHTFLKTRRLSLPRQEKLMKALKEILEQSGAEEPKLMEESQSIEVKRKTRATAFREKVREIYDYSCAVCEKKRFTRLNHPEVESSHIFPKEKNGSDDLRNGIVLCRLHHWAFDEGLFSIRNDYSIIIENRIRKDKNYDEISRFKNKKIVPPKEERYKPHPIFLTQHRKIHVFK